MKPKIKIVMSCKSNKQDCLEDALVDRLVNIAKNIQEEKEKFNERIQTLERFEKTRKVKGE